MGCCKIHTECLGPPFRDRQDVEARNSDITWANIDDVIIIVVKQE